MVEPTPAGSSLRDVLETALGPCRLVLGDYEAGLLDDEQLRSELLPKVARLRQVIDGMERKLAEPSGGKG